MKIVLLMVIKNEASNLRECIDHYILQGVDHFYICDDNSTDGFEQTIEDIKDRVTVIKYKEQVHDDPFAFFHRGGFHVRAYTQILNETDAKDSDWIILVNPDEFIYMRSKYKTIRKFLEGEGSKFSCCPVPLKRFGGMGLLRQPESIVDTFVERSIFGRGGGLDKDGNPILNPTSRGRTACKSITRTKVFNDDRSNVKVHIPTLTGTSDIEPYYMKADGSILDPFVLDRVTLAMELKSVIEMRHQKYDIIACNHYQVQSVNDWFGRVEKTRQYPVIGSESWKNGIANDTRKNINSGRTIDYITDNGKVIESYVQDFGRADLLWLQNFILTHTKKGVQCMNDFELRDLRRNWVEDGGIL